MAAPSNYLVIQSDWYDVLKRENGKAWVTCKKNGSPSICGELKSESASYDGLLNSLSASDGFRIADADRGSIEVAHADPNCRCTFVAPRSTFRSIHLTSVASLDVNGGELGVSACSSGKLCIWEKSRGVILRTLEGHVSDVYTCRFFPSGMVVLSGGADMRLKIWSAETGQCPVTLTGHTGGILDTAIVDRGRNVISVSRDGTARLWDCGSTEALVTLADTGTVINGCALAAAASVGAGSDLGHDEREIGTGGKLLLLACEDRFLRGVSVYDRQEVLSVHCPSAVNTCTFVTDTLTVSGCHDGTIVLTDVRKTSQPLRMWLESSAPVLSLLPHKSGFIASKSDGTCTLYSLESDRRVQFTGPDCESIYRVASDGKFLFTCSRDAAIRKYQLPT